MSFRRVVKAVFAREQSEGDGARVKRSIGTSELRNFDPFLMLDLFTVPKPAGFPRHPHRGFQTVTYLLPDSPGTITHADFCGHIGTLKAGDVQWMHAGKGILHSEMPGSDGKPARGLQLWVNVPEREKLTAPAYQEFASADMPRAELNGVKAVVIAGQALGVEAKIFTKTPMHYIHFNMNPGSELIHPLSKSMNAFIFGLSGTARIGDDEKVYKDSHTLVLDREGESIKVVAGEKGFDFVLCAGEPIGEPIVQYGPFVMSSVKDIHQAFNDYQLARNGFENAHDWVCPISDRQ